MGTTSHRGSRRNGALALVLAALLSGAAGAPATAADPVFDDELDSDELTDLAVDDAGAAADLLAEREELPAAAAAAAVDALLARRHLEDELGPSDAAPPERVEAVADRFLDALAEAPESRFVGRAIAELVWRHERDGEPRVRLADRVAELPEPARTALMLNREISGGEPARALLALALDRRPGHPVLLHRAAEESWDPALRITLYEAAWEALGEVRPPPPRRALELFARLRMAALLEAGEIAEAAELWAEAADLLEAAGDAEAVERESGAGEAPIEVGGLPFEGAPDEIGVQLAAVARLSGDDALARRLLSDLAAVEPAEESDDDEERHFRPARAIVLDLLEPRPDDAFVLLTELAVAHAGAGSWDPEVHSPAVRLAAAELAEREGYPELSGFLLGELIDELAMALEDADPADDRSDLPLGDELESRIAARRARLAARLDELRARRALLAPFDGRDAGAEIVARALAAGPPRLIEQPLPAAIAPIALGREDAERESERQGEGYRLPADLAVRRLERAGDEVTAVARDSLDGYWAIRSSDRGATWSEPLYTGVRDRRPYGVPAASGLPLATERALELEVDVWGPEALDRAEPWARGIYLDLPWDRLARDGDGDGVTDLAEGLLLTDPQAADSDGDGIADGRDPLPQVAHAPGCSPRAQALAIVLRRLALGAGWFPGDESDESNESDAPVGCVAPGSPAAFGPERRDVHYLVGRRSRFSEIAPAARVVVLTDDELAAAERILGPLHPTRLELFALDHAGSRALAIWRGYDHGLLALRYRDGAWQPVIGVGGGGCMRWIDTYGVARPFDPP